ncbi:MAG: patatin-like phospholipase family protein [Turicibacter sp.]|nr:patatin-like phospholipase family protein [Turicibacter sp.]
MPGKVRILSIDGGGIRGVIPATILIRIEELLQEYSGDKSARISDYFDLIAGTSTGGILTALCVCPDDINKTRSKYAAKDILDMYVDKGKKIFTRTLKTQTVDYFGLFSPIYQKGNFERILEGYLGDAMLSDAVKPCLIPAYDIESGKAVFFSQLMLTAKTIEDVPLTFVVRATSAAPTYFPVQNAEGDTAFIDGGLFANNPALCAYVEATKFPCEPLARDIMVLSLGTGSKGNSYPYKKAKRWGRIGWVIPVIDIYGSAASQVVDHQLRRIYAQKELDANYLRIEPDLSKYDVSYDMDDASAKNIQNLIKVGEGAAEEFDSQLREFIQKIVASHETFCHDDLYIRRKRGEFGYTRKTKK